MDSRPSVIRVAACFDKDEAIILAETRGRDYKPDCRADAQAICSWICRTLPAPTAGYLADLLDRQVSASTRASCTIGKGNRVLRVGTRVFRPEELPPAGIGHEWHCEDIHQGCWILREKSPTDE